MVLVCISQTLMQLGIFSYCFGHLGILSFCMSIWIFFLISSLKKTGWFKKTWVDYLFLQNSRKLSVFFIQMSSWSDVFIVNIYSGSTWDFTLLLVYWYRIEFLNLFRVQFICIFMLCLVLSVCVPSKKELPDTKSEVLWIPSKAVRARFRFVASVLGK